MIMRLEQVYGGGLMTELKALYESAFPKNEKKPFSVIEKTRERGNGEIMAFTKDDGEFLGLAITILYRDMVLLDYFAVRQDIRGGGVGTEAFAMLKSRYEDKRFFLEIETTEKPSQNAAERMRRKRFYEKNGMSAQDYSVLLFGVEMEIMTNGCAVEFREYHEIFEKIFGGKTAKRVCMARREHNL